MELMTVQDVFNQQLHRKRTVFYQSKMVRDIYHLVLPSSPYFVLYFAGMYSQSVSHDERLFVTTPEAAYIGTLATTE